MARIQLIRHRLDRWSKWCASHDSGGLGFPSQASFARLGTPSGRRESVVPIIGVECEETDQAVKSLQISQAHLYWVLVHTYVHNMERHQTAREMGRSESTIFQNLCDADRAIQRWLLDKEAQREKMLRDMGLTDAKRSFPT